MPKRQPSPPVFSLELRDEPHANLVTAWLIAQEGPACSGVLHGKMTKEVAAHLVEAMTKAGFVCSWRVPIGATGV